MYMIVEVSQYVAVASFSEAWIEISPSMARHFKETVASFSEAWIEMCFRPSEIINFVASFSEAWIEIILPSMVSNKNHSRLLLGGVD